MKGRTAHALLLPAIALSLACEGSPAPSTGGAPPAPGRGPAPETPETVRTSPEGPSPTYRNVGTATAYVGDGACAECHEAEAAAYRERAMARSFHRWTPDRRIERPLEEPLYHPPTGFHYAIVEADGGLYQEEFLLGPGGARLHELRRRIDWVMGSGRVARTYFTEENGRLFQLPLTWYREAGWDFSPGYELDNPRFDRLMPDRCLACHGSYPETRPFLEGKYARLSPGIGCERCHGPGALHVRERSAGLPIDGPSDATIVDPGALPLERRLDVCDQCHVHTPVSVLRHGHDAFDYVPSEPLADHIAFYKATGSIDIVSHADRLRQSACFVAARRTARPLECATCHDPHGGSTAGAGERAAAAAPAATAPPAAAARPSARSRPCLECHAPAALAERLASSASLPEHGPTADCVACHMPRVKERTVPHGSFTDHWIRVVGRAPGGAAERAPGGEPTDGSPIEPYFERDRTSPDAAVYRGMGEIVYATRAGDATLLRDAARALERALRSDTTRGDAYFLLGLAHRQLGRTEEAIRTLERSLRLAPDRPQRLHALARAYEVAGRDPGPIDSLYERALELQPALAWVRADHARFLQAAGRRAEAEAAYRAALAERPSFAVAAFNLGTLLTASGRLGEATEAFREAVRLDPSLGEALASLLHLRVRGSTVAAVRILGSPLSTLPLRDRGAGAVRLRVGGGDRGPGVTFVNVPPGASVRVVEPDGTRVWGADAERGPAATWDLRSDAGTPIAGGLYRVQVLERSADGRRSPPRGFHFGVVRVARP